MLLKSLPTFNVITFPSDSPFPCTLRNKDFPPLVPVNTIVNAIPNSRNADAGTVTPLRAQSASDQEAEASEAPVNRKLALASWLSNADANGEAGEQAPRHAFKSMGTRSAPSRSSIPGKFSKYSASLSPPRSHGENREPSGKPPKREPRFWTPKPIERRFENRSREDEGAGEGGIAVGSHGVSYRLPGAPFEYQYSYTETPRVKPLALREAPFVPFGPTTMPRPWTGRAPLPPSKKKLPEFDSFKLPPPNKKGVKHVQAPGPFLPGQGPRYVKTREEVLGDPLTPAEAEGLVQSCCHTNRQLNIGRDGLTHNMLENIHAHWKRRRVCKIKCKGVSTVDIDNVCYHLEEKTGGKIIHRAGGVVYLFRGRNYNYRTRPRFPLMLWKPAAAVYPRLIERAPGGLTVEEANELRRKGRTLLPICKLGKNGVYLNLAKDVRDAFEESELVRINCQGLKPSDYKKIGAKLKDLVPCVLLSFEREHVLMWRGKDWKSRFSEKGAAVRGTSLPSECLTDDAANSNVIDTLPLDENFSSESLVSHLSSNTQDMPESDCTLSKNVVDEASYDTAVAGPYSEKSGGTHFSLSEVAARINSDVDCLEDKLNTSSSSEAELVEVTESSTIEKFSDEQNIQTCVELEECVDSGASKSAANPYIECLGQDSFDLPLLELDEFAKPDEALFTSGRQQMAEAGDILLETVNDEASVNHMALTVDPLEKPIVSPFLTSEAPEVISDNLTEAADGGFELYSSELEPAKHTEKGNNGLDGVYANELTVHSTAVNSQLNKGGLDIESLWQQGIESGRVLLLDETVLDPDIVHEKAIAFAKDAPEGPYFKRNFNSRKKPGKPSKKDPQDRMANPSGGQKTTPSNGNGGREISSYDDVPRGGLPLDELARLLAP